MSIMPQDEEDAATAAALDRFVSDGSDLSREMEIDFFVAVPNDEAGRLVAVRAEAIGFKAVVKQDADSGDWTCYCSKTMIPELRAVRDVEKAIDVIGRDYGGRSDGFGSYGNAIGPN